MVIKVFKYGSALAVALVGGDTHIDELALL